MPSKPINNSITLVEVIVLTFNQEKTIRQTLENILNQKCDFNYIVKIYDDCSTDNTVAICEQYSERNHTLFEIYINQKNIGAAKNFYQALGRIQCDYVAICEGDDYWIDQNKLQLQIECLKQDSACSLSWTHALNINDSNNQEELSGHKRPKLIGLPYILSNGWFIRTATIVFRSNSLQVIPNWFQEIYSTDYFLQVLLLQNGYAIKLPVVTAVYRRHINGISHVNWLQHITRNEKIITFLDKLNEYLCNKHYKEITQQQNSIKCELLFTVIFRRTQLPLIERVSIIAKYINLSTFYFLILKVLSALRMKITLLSQGYEK